MRGSAGPKKVLFYGERCSDGLDLFGVMRALRGRQDVVIAYASKSSESARALAQRQGFAVTDAYMAWDVLVTVKMHGTHVRALSKAYQEEGKSVCLIQHALDTYAHLFSEYRDQPIDFFDVLCVAGPVDAAALSAKFGDKVRITGIPRLDKLNEAHLWDKQEIYDLVGTDNFWIVTVAGENVWTKRLERQFFEELPDRLGTSEPLYKIHPNHSIDRFAGYNHKFIDDDTRTTDITYELVNAAAGVVSTVYPSFMVAEASLLRKPVVCYGDPILPPSKIDKMTDWRHDYLKRAVPVVTERWRIDKINSSFESPAFNEHQEQLANEFIHDGQNSLRVARTIMELVEAPRAGRPT